MGLCIIVGAGCGTTIQDTSTNEDTVTDRVNTVTEQKEAATTDIQGDNVAIQAPVPVVKSEVPLKIHCTSFNCIIEAAKDCSPAQFIDIKRENYITKFEDDFEAEDFSGPEELKPDFSTYDVIQEEIRMYEVKNAIGGRCAYSAVVKSIMLHGKDDFIRMLRDSALYRGEEITSEDLKFVDILFGEAEPLNFTSGVGIKCIISSGEELATFIKEKPYGGYYGKKDERCTIFPTDNYKFPSR